MSVIVKEGGQKLLRVYAHPDLRPEDLRVLLQNEIAQVDKLPVTQTTSSQQIQDYFEGLDSPRAQPPRLTISGVLIPEAKVPQGLLIRSVSIVWHRIVSEVGVDWSKAYDIPSNIWEEIVAGAFHSDGFDSVTLTPRSGDHGRDVIAMKSGVGCIKIIGSVKAYKPGHLVKHDDVRALLGVLSGEQDASKGIITTTSDFAPLISSDPFIKPFLPTRLELLNGDKLKAWLIGLAKRKR